jgi:hypothetical protein
MRQRKRTTRQNSRYNNFKTFSIQTIGKKTDVDYSMSANTDITITDHIKPLMRDLKYSNYSAYKRKTSWAEVFE